MTLDARRSRSPAMEVLAIERRSEALSPLAGGRHGRRRPRSRRGRPERPVGAGANADDRSSHAPDHHHATRRATSARRARRRPISRDPDILSVDPLLRRLCAAQHRHPAALDRRAVGGGPGLERAGPLPRLERHPQQPPDALARGRRPRHRVPHAVQQQQRQHLRLPGPAALLRAPDPARGALRARRLGDGAGRHLRRQAAELAQRRRRPSGRQLLVHRPALRRPALRGRARRRRRPEQRGRASSSPRSARPPAWAS